MLDLSQGLDFFFRERPSITICEFNATFCSETSKMIYFPLLSLNSTHLYIGLWGHKSFWWRAQSLKFHVLVLIMKFFNFIESFYGRHQHRLAWDMNILGKIWINLKFSNNIIGSLADFNIATAEAPASRPTTHSNPSFWWSNELNFAQVQWRLNKNVEIDWKKPFYVFCLICLLASGRSDPNQ